jgi:shikimate kinase
LTVVTDERPLVVFIGAPAAGKTKIGKRVAAILEAEFIDTDKRIVAAHGPIAQIFVDDGERYFRALERAEVIRSLSRRAVVSFGGGAVLDAQTQADLLGHRVVHVTVSAEAVEPRLRGAKRPLVANGVEDWKALVVARTPLYLAVASRTVDTSSTSLDTIAAEIAAWIIKDES